MGLTSPYRVIEVRRTNRRARSSLASCLLSFFAFRRRLSTAAADWHFDATRQALRDVLLPLGRCIRLFIIFQSGQNQSLMGYGVTTEEGLHLTKAQRNRTFVQEIEASV